jgi:hypothetical protein
MKNLTRTNNSVEGWQSYLSNKLKLFQYLETSTFSALIRSTELYTAAIAHEEIKSMNFLLKNIIHKVSNNIINKEKTIIIKMKFKIVIKTLKSPCVVKPTPPHIPWVEGRCLSMSDYLRQLKPALRPAMCTSTCNLILYFESIDEWTIGLPKVFCENYWKIRKKMLLDISRKFLASSTKLSSFIPNKHYISIRLSIQIIF